MNLENFSRQPIIAIKNLPKTLSTGIQLATVGFENSEDWYKKKQHRKIILKTLLHPIFSYHWFQLLKSDEFKHITEKRKRLYIKPFRAYISTKWSKIEKVKALVESYAFLQEKGLENTILNGHLIAAEITLDEQHHGILKLEYSDQFRKEGELALTLESEQCGGRIASVAFSFVKNEQNQWTCLLGCVQAHVSKENFKLSQKLLHGMRPNAFMICSLQELLKNLSCQYFLGVGDKIQAHRKKHFIHIERFHKINFDYDNFYNEIGGKDLGNDWYEIPISPERKSLQNIKSKKRSLYRKRYELLDSVAEKIAKALKPTF